MTTLVLFVLFVSAMISIGVWGMKRTKSVNDFVLGGRNIGPWLLALSYGTAYFSAVVFIGFAGMLGWKFGLGVIWIALGNAFFGGLLAWLVLGRRTRRMSHNLSAMTMPEFFEARYEAPLMKLVSAFIIFIFLLPYSASVFKGLGHLFQVNFGISFNVAVLIMTALTAVYLVMGGYIAQSRTDFVQGIIMIVGSIALVVAFMVKFGHGPIGLAQAASQAFDEHAAAKLGTAPAGGMRNLILGALVFMTSFGTWGLPQMIQKYYAIKDERMIKRGAAVTTVFALIVVTTAYFVGSLSHLFFNEKPTNFDVLVPEMLTKTLSEPLMALILLLILSASMSTLASLVLVSSSAVAVDVLKVHTRTDMKASSQVMVMRVLTVVFLLASFLLAWYADAKGGFIVSLMSLSWGAVAGAFMAPYLYGLYWRRTSRAGAMTGMICGLAIMIAGFFVYGQALLPVTACVAMIAPFAVVPAVSLLTPAPSQATITRAFDSISPSAPATVPEPKEAAA